MTDTLTIPIKLDGQTRIKHSPYKFIGDWTDLEKQVLIDAILAHERRNVDADFPYWIFTKKSGTSYVARRENWAAGEHSAHAVIEMAKYLRQYYEFLDTSPLRTGQLTT